MHIKILHFSRLLRIHHLVPQHGRTTCIRAVTLTYTEDDIIILEINSRIEMIQTQYFQIQPYTPPKQRQNNMVTQHRHYYHYIPVPWPFSRSRSHLMSVTTWESNGESVKVHLDNV